MLSWYNAKHHTNNDKDCEGRKLVSTRPRRSGFRAVPPRGRGRGCTAPCGRSLRGSRSRWLGWWAPGQTRAEEHLILDRWRPTGPSCRIRLFILATFCFTNSSFNKIFDKGLSSNYSPSLFCLSISTLMQGNRRRFPRLTSRSGERCPSQHRRDPPPWEFKECLERHRHHLPGRSRLLCIGCRRSRRSSHKSCGGHKNHMSRSSGQFQTPGWVP